MEQNPIRAYKGFDKSLCCRGFQYEVGKEYEHQGGISLCKSGFHACENPFDVPDFYGDILNNRYCEVEQSGSIEGDGKKTVSSKLKVKAEIGFAGLFKAGIEWLKEVTDPAKIKPNDDSLNDNGGDWAQIGSSGDSARIGSSGDSARIGSSGDWAQIGSSGDSARIGSSGDSAQIGSSGDSARIGSSGDSAQIDSTGEDNVICCAGHGSKIKAKQGSWITLAEWVRNDKKRRWVPKCVKTEFVDGERIKADTWYKLVDGEFVECDD